MTVSGKWPTTYEAVSAKDIIFSLGRAVPLEESRHVEFKELSSANPVRSIVELSDNYAVGFLNSEGGSIFWGIRDTDRVVTGIILTPSDRDRLNRDVASKLNGIQPQLDPSRFKIIFHPIIGAAEDTIIVELRVPKGASQDPYFTSGHDAFVRLDGVLKRLSGQQLTDWIKTRITPKEITSLGVGVDPELLALSRRVRHVFAGHGLTPAHWAAFFERLEAPFSINFTDLQSDTSLLSWLSEAKIQWISNTFLIRTEWIKGEDEKIFEYQSYDKNPARFLSEISRHVDALVWQSVPASPEAWFLRWGLESDWSKKGHSGVFVVIRIPLACLSNELTVYKYISDFAPYGWNDGRTAVQLRAWARLLLVTKGITCVGREMSYELGQTIWSNGVFLNQAFDDYSQIQRCRDDWNPEDYALYPVESAFAKNDQFFPAVIEFLKKHDLPFQPTRLFRGSES